MNTIYCDGQHTDNVFLGLQRCLVDLEKRGADTHKSLDDMLHARNKRVTLRNTLSLFRSLLRPVKNKEATDAEINQLKDHLNSLTSQRQEAATELTRLWASVSACGRVPPEIWSVVFRFCLPDDEIYLRPNRNSAPLILCAVCRLWRGVAISTPLLWASLSVNRNWRKRPGQGLLQAWLLRSKGLPLTIEISLSSPSRTIPHHDHVAPRMLLACSRRWRRLRLNITDSLLLQEVLNSPMPLLQTLEFGSNSVITNLTIDPTLAPNLRSVSFLATPLDPTPISLPWDQLTHLSSRYWTDVHSHLDVLERCPNLEHARLHILHAHCDKAPFCPPLLMANLKVMEIIALRGNAMRLILERLELPSLDELSLVVPDESPEYGASGWPMDAVVSLIKRSSCKALRVFLEGINISLADGNKASLVE